MFYLLSTIFAAMWIISIFILRKWKYFYLFFALNLVISIIYYYLITQTNVINLASKEIGFAILFNFLIFIITHTIIVFIFALYYKLKLSKNVNQ